MAADESSVRVAVRVRPLSPAEVLAGCGVCARVPPGEPCVAMGADRLFTFDLAFDTAAEQRAVYAAAVRPLVRAALHGYNATVLAYGQTGSGKTYTMGSGWEADDDERVNGSCADSPSDDDEGGERVRRGIIPRAVRDLFVEAEREGDEARAQGRLPPEFAVHAQFIELYNEELLDLLEPLQARGALRIAEEAGGGVRVLGAAARTVRSAHDALDVLRAGALARTTAATAMNTSSSRSHAVFSLLVKSRRLVPDDSAAAGDGDADVGPEADQFETLTAKIHFVDLAGSERLKRTGATGERAREGISINSGLLALGNVISALGDRSRRASHVPYRDSKLTRLLQDSLGGNSQTVMIACVSPSDRDFMETLNTLKYANRARNIKNKLVVNQDLSARTIQQLRREVARLQLELQEFRQGKRVPRTADGDGDAAEDGLSDLYHENLAMRAETEALRTRLKAAQDTIDQLSRRNADLLAERALAPLTAPGEPPAPADCSLATLVGGYVAEVEELRAKLIEANAMHEATRRRESRARPHPNLKATATLLHDAKRDLQEEKQLLARSMGELEMRRKLEGGGEGGDGLGIGERERAEGESADESEPSEAECDDAPDDEDDSDTKACTALSEELAALSGDIDMKARLIEELELSQQRLGALRHHYEQRLQALHQQIKATQDERDKVLSSCVSSPAAASAAGAGDKVRRVRDEYERRLADMARELKRLQAAQSQHARLARDQANTAHELARLRTELQERKREKVKVMQRMREEARRHATAEKARAKEVAQLRKESRRHANMIRTLRAERDLKDQVLRRKREEVEALRRSRRTPASRNVRAVDADARDAWAKLARWASRATLARALCGELEAGLERALADRERVRAEVAAGTHPDAEAARDHLRYLQQTIADTQQQIMQLEDEGEEGALPDLLRAVRSAEAGRYALERMAALLLQHGHNAARLRTLLQDTQARLRQLEAAAERDRLQRTVGGVGLAAFVSSGTATRSVSPADERPVDESQRTPGSPATSPPFTTPFQRNSPRRGSVRLRDLGVVPRAEPDLMTQSLSESPPQPVPLTRVPSAPGGLRYASSAADRAPPTLPAPAPPHRPPLYRGLVPVSPPRTPPGDSPRGNRSLAKPASLEATPPGSPGAARRARDLDVFRRLAGGALAASPDAALAPHRSRLRQLPRPKRAVCGGGVSLECTHVAEGHAGAVLALAAAGGALYSGGADRSVRQWDLSGGGETWRGLCGAAVAACAARPPLVAAGAGPGVHVFDARAPQPVATLWCADRGSRHASVTCVTPAPRDTQLYSAAADRLRLWDLRSLKCVWSGPAGHAAAVMCVCAVAEPGDLHLLLTGSKDHYVRALRLRPATGEAVARTLLLPPHYDGVQGLAAARDPATHALRVYSASRDMTLKRWEPDVDAASPTHTVTGAHKGWVTGVAALPALGGVASCGRDGALRLWDAELRPLARADAPDSLHALAHRPPHALYTAGNGGEVRAWRVVGDP